MKNHSLLSVMSVLAAALLWAHGCSSDETAPPGPLGGQGGAAVSVTVGPPASSSITTGTGGGTPADESTSCSDAVPLEAKENTLGGTFYDFSAILGEPGDVDYFTFEAQAGDWVRVSTDTEIDNPPADTVVTLLSEDGNTQIARNNDVVGASTPDSEIFYRVTEPGTYCIEVEDAAGQGGVDFTYRAIMVPMDFALYDFYNLDTEPNDTTSAPQTNVTFNIDVNTQQISTGFAGLWDASGDVDVYQWTAPAGALDVNVVFTPDGPSGYGSTQDPGIINIYEPDGTTLLAQLDVQKGSDRITSVPVVEGQTYFLEVNYPSTAMPGANDFYYLKFYTSDSLNPQEMSEPGNDASGGAEIATAQVDGQYDRYFVGGLLPVPDEDWWSFQAAAGDEIILACSSWRSGSGLRDATFSIYRDPAQAPLQTETETEDADILWSSSNAASKPLINATSTGTYYFRVNATQQAPNITSNFYLCGIHVRTP